MGILNSSLISWWYTRLIPEEGRVFAEVKAVNLRKLPIPKIAGDKAKKTLKEIDDVSSSILKSYANGKIAAAEKARSELDDLVFSLYGLSKSEVKIIKSWSAKNEKSSKEPHKKAA